MQNRHSLDHQEGVEVEQKTPRKLVWLVFISVTFGLLTVIPFLVGIVLYGGVDTETQIKFAILELFSGSMLQMAFVFNILLFEEIVLMQQNKLDQDVLRVLSTVRVRTAPIFKKTDDIVSSDKPSPNRLSINMSVISEEMS